MSENNLKQEYLTGLNQIIKRVGGLTWFLLFFCVYNAHAYDFMDRSRGLKLYYNIVSEESKTVEVTRGEDWERYEGNYTIPRVVRHNGKRYRVVAIGKRAFADCDELRNITFSSNITRIDSAAFSHCESLTRLKLPQGLKYLGDHAFAFCSFPYVRIPASVNHIGRGCFSYCQYVVDIMVDENNTIYSDGGGCSCIINKTLGILIQGCDGTIVTDEVRQIGDEAFAGCKNLHTIKLPPTILEIGEDAFRSSGLQTVVLPQYVTELKPRLFFNCTDLRSVSFLGDIIIIGEKVFSNCKALEEIKINTEDPSAINDDIFPNEVYSRAKLVVPFLTADKYRETDGWKKFRYILDNED